jgi:hypothetical protein
VFDLCRCEQYPEFRGRPHYFHEHGFAEAGEICGCEQFDDVFEGKPHRSSTHARAIRIRKERARDDERTSALARAVADAVAAKVPAAPAVGRKFGNAHQLSADAVADAVVEKLRGSTWADPVKTASGSDVGAASGTPPSTPETIASSEARASGMKKKPRGWPGLGSKKPKLRVTSPRYPPR